MAKQIRTLDPTEEELLQPVLRLFPAREYDRVVEVPLGWRKIDLVCAKKTAGSWVAIELKVQNWRSAFRQAVINQQLVDKSFVAMWHRHMPNMLKHRELFEQHGIGIIEVFRGKAKILLDVDASAPSLLKQRHRQIVNAKLLRGATAQGAADETISLLPA